MTQNNETWGNLPNEILNLIVKDCGRDCLTVKWMFVNRKWFDFYLSLVFRSINIELIDTDIKLKKIISSPFKIGNKVKRINFKSLGPTENFENFDITSNRLTVLMKRTPNIEEIGFFNEDKWCHEAWIHFSVVLLNNNCWKLRVLPKIEKKSFSFSSHYYLCAYRMRHSLVELDLTFGMIGTLDFKVLEEFIALERLRIDEKVVNGIDELNMLLRHTPKLKEINVNFADHRLKSLQNNCFEQQSCSFSALKLLKLCNFTPKNNSELLIFTTENFAVNKLQIIAEKNSQWPAAEIESHTQDIFFKALSSMREFEITTSGIFQGTNYKTWLKSLNDSTKRIHLALLYIKKDIDIVMTIRGGESKPVTTVIYEIGRSYDRNLSGGINILNNMGDNVYVVEIAGVKDDIKSLLIAVIIKERVKLEHLVIVSSYLNIYSSSANAVLYTRHIKRLKFLKSRINPTAFKSFMTEFQSLDYIQIGTCKFEDNLDNNIIDMSNTTIGTIHLLNYYKLFPIAQHTNNNRSITIVTVYISTLNCTKFYMIVEENITKITQTIFHLFCSRLQVNNELLLLNIRVKSLKQLLLRKTVDSKDMVINFPQWH